MCVLMLDRPSKQYAEQVMSYKEEMLQCGDSFDGCAGLEDVQSFDEWIDFERRLREKYKSGYVPSEAFFSTISCLLNGQPIKKSNNPPSTSGTPKQATEKVILLFERRCVNG